MTLVGLAFALVMLVWVVLQYRAGLATSRLTALEHTVAVLIAEPKPTDHTAELAALTKKVSTLEASMGLRNLR